MKPVPLRSKYSEPEGWYLWSPQLQKRKVQHLLLVNSVSRYNKPTFQLEEQKSKFGSCLPHVNIALVLLSTDQKLMSLMGPAKAFEVRDAKRSFIRHCLLAMASSELFHQTDPGSI